MRRKSFSKKLHKVIHCWVIYYFHLKRDYEAFASPPSMGLPDRELPQQTEAPQGNPLLGDLLLSLEERL